MVEGGGDVRQQECRRKQLLSLSNKHPNDSKYYHDSDMCIIFHLLVLYFTEDFLEDLQESESSQTASF